MPASHWKTKKTMQLYETKTTWGAQGTWHGTRGDAHEAAKNTPVREAARVYLWEVPNGKPDMLAALNGDRPATTLVGAWGLTPRGGLAPIENDAAQAELDSDEPPARQEPAGAAQAPAGTTESATAFWGRVEGEEAARKAAKGHAAPPPSQSDLDAL